MIHGLTDRGCAFAQIGNIRKGMTLKKRRADGSEYTVPTDLDYFVVEFDEQETDAQEKFTAAYPGETREINCLLPFDDISRCWDPYCEAYTAGRMVARSDGEYFIYLTNQAGTVEVINGANINTGEKVPHKDVLWGEGTKAVKCRPVGRLKVIIPELRRAAYMVVHTTSIHDVANLSDQLRAISQLRDGHIAGIPLVLRRRPKEISVPGDKGGPRRRLVKWMLSIEADPSWVEKMLTVMGNAALPEGSRMLVLPQGESLSIPENMDQEEDDQIDAEFSDMGQEPDKEPIPPINVQTTPAPAPAAAQPSVLDAAIAEAKAKNMEAQKRTEEQVRIAEALQKIDNPKQPPQAAVERPGDPNWRTYVDGPETPTTPPPSLAPKAAAATANRVEQIKADLPGAVVTPIASVAPAAKQTKEARPTIEKNSTLFWSICFTNLGLKRSDVLKHLESNNGDYDKTLADLWPK